MRELIERIEELLYLQERLGNLLLMSSSGSLKLNLSSALDVLYHNVELLDLLGEILSGFEQFQEELSREYITSLLQEALSWMLVILPAIEDSCPIFLQGMVPDPLLRMKDVLSSLEASSHSDYYMFISLGKEIRDLSSLLKYYILLARRTSSSLI